VWRFCLVDSKEKVGEGLSSEKLKETRLLNKARDVLEASKTNRLGAKTYTVEQFIPPDIQDLLQQQREAERQAHEQLLLHNNNGSVYNGSVYNGSVYNGRDSQNDLNVSSSSHTLDDFSVSGISSLGGGSTSSFITGVNAGLGYGGAPRSGVISQVGSSIGSIGSIGSVGSTNVHSNSALTVGSYGSYAAHSGLGNQNSVHSEASADSQTVETVDTIRGGERFVREIRDKLSERHYELESRRLSQRRMQERGYSTSTNSVLA